MSFVNSRLRRSSTLVPSAVVLPKQGRRADQTETFELGVRVHREASARLEAPQFIHTGSVGSNEEVGDKDLDGSYKAKDV
ncbi:hypothetical protein FRC09_017660, partial [Ceratobasidium sp. 395]